MQWPVSVAQHRMWFLDRLEPGSAAYNVPTVMRLRGHLDAGALGRALQVVAERHEVLRSGFVENGGTPYQVVSPKASVPLRVMDADGAAGLRRLVEEEIGRPFDLRRAPPARAMLARCADEDHVLILIVHHIVFDDWSAGVLGRELSAAYEALAAGRHPRLDPLPATYRDFVAAEREWLRSADAGEQLERWRERLRGAPVLDPPTDRARPAVRSGRVVSHDFRVPADLTARLSEAAEAARCTLFMALLTGFLVLLRCWTGQDDLVVAIPVANRVEPEFEHVVGLFTNTVPLRVRLDGSMTLRDCVEAVRPAAIEAVAGQRVPYERVVEAVGPPRDGGRPPLAQCLFAFSPGAVHDLAAGLERTGLACEPYPVLSVASKFEVALCVESVRGSCKAWIELDGDLFEAATCKRLAAWWREVLEAVADGASGPIADLLTPPATAMSRPRGDVEALVRWMRGLPAGVLDRAGRLAGRLRAGGLRPEQPVVVGARSSPDDLVALLAVLWAGGAYLPAGLAGLVPGPAVTLDELAARSGPEACRLSWPSLRPDALACFAGAVDRAGTPAALECTVAGLAAALDAEAPPLDGVLGSLASPSAFDPVVVDPAGRPVPTGVRGELRLRGASLPRGYAGRPGPTARDFVPDHLGPEPGRRMLATGLLAVAGADGGLRVLGRLPGRALVRGFPVPLHDVESAIVEHPGVEAALAVAVSGDLEGDRVVAFVRWTPEGPAEASLRVHLEGRLPATAVPAALVAGIPATPWGAPDRGAAAAAAAAHLLARDPSMVVADLLFRALRRRSAR